MKEKNLSSLANAIIKTVSKCGEIVVNARRSPDKVDTKAGHGNFVTTYDTLVQEILRKKLSALLPSAGFFGEEGDTAPDMTSGYTFIVDPIDGTFNFIRDYHLSCISVGLVKDGRPVLGIIHQPYARETFAAERGHGAYCNGKRLFVSQNPMSEALISFGTSPYYEELHEKTAKTAYSLFKKGIDIRRSGSAAFDLCAVAAGRSDVFFEYLLQPWDYAAGALLIEEAGGLITTMEGEPITLDRPCSIFASNGAISRLEIRQEEGKEAK